MIGRRTEGAVLRAYAGVVGAALLLGSLAPAGTLGAEPAGAGVGRAAPAVELLPELTAAPAAVPASTRARAEAIYRSMTPTQRVGQLFMAMVTSRGPSGSELATLRKDGVGSFYLSGGTPASLGSVAAMTARLRSHGTFHGVRPVISSDEEGGWVQRLTGPGFTRMPTPLVQGHWSAATLRARSTTWGKQLARAGLTLNLAPVADTVPSRGAKANQPIGRYDREFGHTPSKVSSRVVAFVRGMRAAHVDTAVKHFPGVGRATGHTDLAARVTDPTTRHDAYLAPFRAGLSAGAHFVMVSSAFYPHIDAKHRACFSRTVMTSMLRGELGFDGVIVSDAFNAAAVRSVPVGARAVRFVRAGGTVVLDHTPRIHPMVSGVRAEMRRDPAFAAKVRAAVLTVLVAKLQDHLAA